MVSLVKAVCLLYHSFRLSKGLKYFKIKFGKNYAMQPPPPRDTALVHEAILMWRTQYRDAYHDSLSAQATGTSQWCQLSLGTVEGFPREATAN